MPIAVFALALCGFGIGTTEFVVMGLLPDIAKDVSVSITTAGGLISGYALGVVIGGPVLVASAIRIPRKRMLLALMAIFVLGNLVSALAPSYGLLMVGRIVTSVCHGAFLGVASVVAAQLVDASRMGRAVSLVFAGGAMANVLGAPLGTFIGQNLGWRSTFWMLVGIGVVGFFGIARLVPAIAVSTDTKLSSELGVFRKPQVIIGLLMTALSLGALFTSFTYIAPMLTEVTGYASSALTPLLALFGVGLVVGNTLGGKMSDRIGLIRTLTLALAMLAVVLGLFVFTAHAKIPAAITFLLVGFAGFATVPPLMTRVISKAEGAPTLAAVVTVSASNVGIALGAYLGGVTIDAGLGYTSPNWLGAIMAGLALVLTLVSGAMDRSRTTPAVAARPEPSPSTN
ncbi:MFS transporter [Streptomyces sp. DT24]|uniref:MFS transporter n=1 Tax=unclassified Streptomyces TaxID=2593676 RepID=UPI0023B944EF|nr:MFS transporter [Streptomyces sp. AM 4-1-1]WEH34973.1 MFS transporter [Streptomyces sp. AM 4-1-1]